MQTMMQADADRLAGPRHARGPTRQGHRWGTNLRKLDSASSRDEWSSEVRTGPQSHPAGSVAKSAKLTR
jgi:hypothetical protein